MATDTTSIQSDSATSSVVQEGDVEQGQLTQSGNAPVPVQIPQGENVVRVQVTPGETIQLPFPADGLIARLGDNGNLAVKVGDVTVILLGYAEATGQADITIIGSDGQQVDVAAVLAATDPNIDIQTAAGPGAGDQGTGVDNNGGVFSPFDPASGLGGLNAVGGLDPTGLNYNLVGREFPELIEDDEEPDTAPLLINIRQGAVINEDDLGLGRPELQKLAPDEDYQYQGQIGGELAQSLGIAGAYTGGTPGQGNDPLDLDDHDLDNNPGDPPASDDNGQGVDIDREPLTSTAVVTVNFSGDVPGKISFQNGADIPVQTQLEAMHLTSHGHELQYKLLPAVGDNPGTIGVDESHGEVLVAYYVEEGTQWVQDPETQEWSEVAAQYATIVFSIGVREQQGDTGISEFNLDFTIYGVVDNVAGTPDAIGDIADVLDIDVPFFMVDSDGSVTPSPGDALTYHVVDDVPSFGATEWALVGGEGNSEGTWQQVIKPADTSITLDETDGLDGDSDDVDANVTNILAKAGWDSLTALGAAKTDVVVSFGADGPALGNNEAGKTLFQGDDDDWSNTDPNSEAFQLFVAGGTVERGATNWTITDAEGNVLVVHALQIDANTIVGYANPNDPDGDGIIIGEDAPNPNSPGSIPVFVLNIDPQTGELTLVQLHQINHGDTSNNDESSPSLVIYSPGESDIVASDDFDSLANWSVLDGGSASIVGDIGTTDPQPNPSNQALLLAANDVPGESGDGSSLESIENFFGLPAGTLATTANDGDAGNDVEVPTDGTAIKQTFEVAAGNQLTVKFNFLEDESDGASPSFQDFAFIVVGDHVFRLSNVSLANISSDAGVGSLSWDEESGYLTFTFTFAQDGPVQIGFGVMNEGDTDVDPALLIDSLAITDGASQPNPVYVAGTDFDGDQVTAPLDVTIQDDGPTATIVISKTDTLLLDETERQRGDGIASVTADFGDNFNAGALDFGTDGPGSVTYALVLTGTNVPSGLYAVDPTDTESVIDGIGRGAEILLSKDGNDVVGKIGTTEYFRISVDADGKVTFTQSDNVWHGDTGSNDDSQTLTLSAADALKIVQTLTDIDGDSASGSINLGQGVFSIEDDGPIVSATSESSVSITMDESVGADANDPNTSPTSDEPAEAGFFGTKTGSVAGLFNAVDFGADGAQAGINPQYKLVLRTEAGENIDIGTTEVPTNLSVSDPTGLYPVDNIVLVAVSDYQVNGYVGSYDADSSTNVLAFVVRVDAATGELTVSQALPISHGIDGSSAAAHDDVASLVVGDLGGIFVSLTATDGDGDKATVEAPAALGISFEDDGPMIMAVSSYVAMDENGLPGGIAGGPGDNGGTASADFVVRVDFGQDGEAANAFELTSITATVDGQPLVLATAGGQPINVSVLAVAENGYPAGTLVGWSGPSLSEHGYWAFTVTINQEGQGTFNLLLPLNHPRQDDGNPNNGTETAWEDNILLSVGVRATDGDGDTVNATVTFNVDDDTPTAVGDNIGTFVENSAKVDLGTVLDVLLANDLPGADGINATSPGVVTLANGGVGALGGIFTIENIDGVEHVFYQAPANVADDANDTVQYTLVDKDGDATTATITATVTDRGGGTGLVAVLQKGKVGYEDGRLDPQGQTDLDPIDGRLTLPFKLKITPTDAGDTTDSVVIGGIPSGASASFGALELPVSGGTITLVRGQDSGIYDDFLDSLTTIDGANINVTLEEHDSRDFTITLNGVVDHVAITPASDSIVVDAVAAQPALTDPADQTKVEAGENAANTSFTVNTTATFADFDDANETQIVFIKNPAAGWTIQSVESNGTVLVPIAPVAGYDGYTAYAVTGLADSGSGSVPLTIVVTGPADPVSSTTETIEIKAVAFDVEVGAGFTIANDKAEATQTVDLTITDRTGGTDDVSFVGGGEGGYEDGQPTSAGQTAVDPTDGQLSLAFNLKATATDSGDAVGQVIIGGIPSGATATWTQGSFTLTIAGGGTVTITGATGGTENIAGARAAFLADLIDGNGANLTVTLQEHDSRDVTLTMQSTIGGTQTTGDTAFAIVDAVAAQPALTDPSDQATTETGAASTTFTVTTTATLADFGDGSEQQYVLIKTPDAGWSLGTVLIDGAPATAIPGGLALFPGYTAFAVSIAADAADGSQGQVGVSIVVNGPGNVAADTTKTIEIKAVAIDAEAGFGLDSANDIAQVTQTVDLKIVDRVGGNSDVNYTGGGEGGYEDGQSSSAGQTSADPVNGLLSLAFNLKATATDPGDTVSQTTIGGIPSGATATWTQGGFTLTFGPGSSTITATSGGTGTDASRAAFLADLIDGNGANLTVTLAEHDSRDVNLTMQSVIGGQSTNIDTAFAAVDAVAAQPALVDPANESKQESGAASTNFTVTTTATFADFDDANEAQYILIKNPDAGWSLGTVTIDGVPATAIGGGLTDYPGYTAFAVSTQADANDGSKGSVNLVIEVNGPGDVAASTTKSIEIRAVAIDTEIGAGLGTGNDKAEVTQFVDLTITDRTGGTDSVTLKTDPALGYEDGQPTSAGQNTADAANSQLTLVFTMKVTPTDPTDPVDQAVIGGIPTGATATWTDGVHTLTFAAGSNIITAISGGTENVAGTRAAFLAALESAGGADISVKLAEHDSRDVTLTMNSTVGGTLSGGDHTETATVDAVAAQPSINDSGDQSQAESGSSRTIFSFQTTANFADFADANENQYILIKDFAPGWTLDNLLVNLTEVWASAIDGATLGYPGYSAYLVNDFVDTGSGSISVIVAVGGPGNVPPGGSQQLVEIKSVAIDAVDGSDLTTTNNVAEATQTVNFTVTDTTPTVSAVQTTIRVDEDGFAAGNKDAADDAIGDDTSTDAVTFNGNFSYSTGKDAITSITLGTTGGLTGLTTLDNLPVKTVWDAGTKTLTGFADTDNDGVMDNGERPVFTLAVTNVTSGAYTFTLNEPVRHDAANGGAGANFEDDKSFAINIQVTDADGSPSNVGSATINIDDDTPTARNDTDSVANLLTTTGNVITGLDTTSGAAGVDSKGADGAVVDSVRQNPVYGNSFDNDGSNQFTVTGQYGQLTMNTDGSYSYTRFGTGPLDAVDHFEYALKDGDGDVSTALLDITIADKGTTLTLPVAGQAGALVDEKGLPLGTGELADSALNSDESEKVNGTISFAAPDGVASIQIGTTILTLAQLTTAGTYPLTVADAGGHVGTLVLTGYAAGVLSYTYTLTQNTNGEGTHDDFVVKVTDSDGDFSNGTLVINIKDDAPIANFDNGGTIGSGITANGNVLTNDVLGADGAVATIPVGGVIGVVLGNDPVSKTTGVSTSIVGNFGTLILHADGSYTYVAKPNAQIPIGGTDIFSYTIEDSDGDRAVTQLAITVTPTSIIVAPADKTVDEAALDLVKDLGDLGPGTVTGSLPASADESVSGSLTLPAGVNVIPQSNVPTTFGLFSIDASGNYTYTLVKNSLDHTSDLPNTNPASRNPDNVQETFTIQLQDGVGNTGQTSIVIHIKDDVPSVTLQGIIPTLTVDESDFTFDATADFSGLFQTVAGADGLAAPVAYSLGILIPGLPTNLFDVLEGHQILLVINNQGEVEGRLYLPTDINGLPTGPIAFTVSVDSAGVVTLDQDRAISHPNDTNPDDSVSLIATAITLTASVTDNDGDTSSATANIGDKLVFKDDGPALTLVTPLEALTVDETDFTQNASVNINTLFSIQFGADGPLQISASNLTPAKVFSLAVKSPIITETNLIDIATGQSIKLFQVDAHTIVGKVGVQDAAIFTITIDNNGVLTLDQHSAVQHPTNDPNEPVTMGLADLVTVTFTIRDGDKDLDSETLQIGDKFVFKDDGPSNSATSIGAVGIILDESNGTGSGNDGVNPGIIAAATVQSLFNPVEYGHDGPGAVSYKLQATNNAPAGLWLSGQSAPADQILLVKISDTEYQGKVGGIGATAFSITINPLTGQVTVTQLLTLEHAQDGGPGAAHDDLASLAASIFVVQRVTDHDGDFSEAASATPLAIGFQDDGPRATADSQLASVDDNVVNHNIGTVAGLLLNDGYGADGPAASNAITIAQGSLNGTVTISGGNLLYTSATNVVPGANQTETFTYTITDKDGDTTTATFSVLLTDTKATFSLAPVNSSVDEEGLTGGNVGDSYASGDLAGQAISVTNQALNINYGTDVPGTVTFDAGQPGLTGLTTAGGTPVNIAILGTGEVVGYTGGVVPTTTGAGSVVFFASLNASGTGSYNFTLVKPLDHPTANTEDDKVLTFAITAKDAEGEGSPATFTVTVDDDGPIAVNDGTTAVVALNSAVGGNVLTNDFGGADGKDSVIGIKLSSDASFSVPGTLNVPGGSLTMGANGQWTFTQTGAVASPDTYTFTYLMKDKDGDTAQATFTVDVINAVKPSFSDAVAVVDEDGLIGGANPHLTVAQGAGDLVGGSGVSEAVYNGTVAVNWNGNTGTLALGIDQAQLNTITLHSGGSPLLANVTGIGTQTLVIKDGVGNPVMEITINNSGQYQVTLKQSIEHSNASNGDNENTTDPILPVTVTATNSAGSASQLLNITIDDDQPTTVNDAISVNESTTTGANVMFILDVSGSMGWGKDADSAPTGGNPTRLTLAKNAILATIQKYVDANGGYDINGNNANVKFQLVLFSSATSNPTTVWVTASATNAAGSIQAYVNAAGLGSNATNYDNPLIAAQTAFNNSGKLNGAVNVSYFLSDGAPNEGSTGDGQNNENGPTAGTTDDDGIGVNEEAAWKGFLTNNDIMSYAIGIGPSVSVVDGPTPAGSGQGNDELDPIAYDGKNEVNLNAISVANLDDLGAVLGGTVGGAINGNVLANDKAGADGWNSPVISKITYDGKDYTDGDNDGDIVVETAAGTLTIYTKDVGANEAGDYGFSSKAVAADTPLEFDYWVTDTDNDPVEGTLTVTVLNVAANEAPAATNVNASGNEDTVITVTLAGTDSDGTIAAFKLATLPANGTLYLADGVTLAQIGVEYASGSFKFQPSANYNGPASFTYTVKDDDGAFDATAATASITVNPVNDAPVLNAALTPVLTAIAEDSGAPSGAVGTLVSAIAGTSGIANVTDLEGNSIGIAITGKTGAGSWWYSIDGGANWLTLGAPNDDTARLLNASALVYYQPAANEEGANIANITFRAWDQTSGSNGATADTNPGNGGSTAFSSATDTAAITVTPDVAPVAYDNYKQAVVTQSGGDTVQIVDQQFGAAPTFTIAANANSAADANWVRNDAVYVFQGTNELELVDDNGSSNGGSGSAKVYSQAFTLQAGQTGVVTFDVDIPDSSFGNGDVLSWQLYSWNGSSYVVVAGKNGTHTTNADSNGFSISIDAAVSNTKYRVFFEAKDNTSNSQDYNAEIDNFEISVTNPLVTNTTNATGNVRTDAMNLPGSSDPWGATDTNGTEATTLQVFVSGVWTTVAGGAGTVVDTPNGTLTISQDGAYTFVPDADIANVGEQDVVQYRLRQDDGDFDTANLVLGIGSSAYVEPTATNVTGNSSGTGNADILLGNDADNNMNGGNSDDRLEGRGGNDTLTGGSGTDFLFGGSGNDVLVYDNADFFDGGADRDTLRFDGTGTLSYDDAKWNDIEVVNLNSNSSEATLSLSLADVLDILAENGGVEKDGGGTHQNGGINIALFVTGQTGSNDDNVALNGAGWSDTGNNVTADMGNGSQTFSIFTHNNSGNPVYVAVANGMDMSLNGGSQFEVS
nr:DUF5801 repeats-in-toxin domain-containing protein [uncultured Dongia sp.]